MVLDIGIRGYLTTSAGVGGSIKASPEDFIVEEIPRPPARDGSGGHAIATLRVRNWETNRLVRQLARTLHISRRRIGFAGTKDKRALSVRLLSFEGVDPDAILRLRMKDVEVLDAYPAAKALEIGDLLGNRFRIAVRALSVSEGEAAPAVRETRRQVLGFGGFPNFFGPQRFGSIRPVTHLVGRHIARGEFREAVDAYVANPIPGEGEESHRVRRELAETRDVRAALRSYPRAFGFEKAILNHLAAHPSDYVGSLRRLPLNLLIMFVHAYQAYLFNRILSERLARDLPIHEPVPGDLVLPADADGLPDRSRAIDVDERNLVKVAGRCRAGKAWVSAILFGAEPRFAGGIPGEIERDIVASERLRPEDFVIPELQRVSSKGTRKEILAPVAALDADLRDSALHLSFDLTRGCYATSLIREFTKAG